MATQQMPKGTHRRGVGDRPYSSYVIYRLNGEDKEVQLGLTRRVEDSSGKMRWQGDNGKDKSPLLLVHREAVEWLLGSRPATEQAEPESKEAPKDLTEALRESVEAAKKENDPKAGPDSTAPERESVPQAPAPKPKAPVAARKQPAKVA